ncbi:MAG: hypothetical protein NTZ32_08805 [Planctomycetales bacterium]|nr:hypothetical protein [Planctomycetales bacterium]
MVHEATLANQIVSSIDFRSGCWAHLVTNDEAANDSIPLKTTSGPSR